MRKHIHIKLGRQHSKTSRQEFRQLFYNIGGSDQESPRVTSGYPSQVPCEGRQTPYSMQRSEMLCLSHLQTKDEPYGSSHENFVFKEAG